MAPVPGALGKAFTAVRVLQIISLITIIGMTSKFISDMNGNDQSPPSVLVGTLSVTSIAVLYCAITWILYYDEILPYLANTAIDGLLLIAVIVVAVTVGKPLSYLNCQHLGSASSMFGTYAAVESLGQSLNHSNFSYALWVAATKSTCLMMKAIWGLSIALCILFAFSAVCTVFIWRRTKATAQKLDDC
jgi:hypothetical protein